jgi:uncharacterized phage protein (TIGR01671 family)
MRENKFRAWDKHRKVMCEVMNINFDAGVAHIVDKNRNEYWGREMKEVELLQYTGLRDKNGKEIYEGSIVYQEFHDDRPLDVAGFIGVVDQLEGSWVINNRINHAENLWSEVNVNEIIGNIYENPTLLADSNYKGDE